MALPTGYTELEYVESSGTQYVDTGLSLTAAQISGLKFTLNAAFLDSTEAIMGEGNTFIGFYSSGPQFAAAAGGTVKYDAGKTFDTNWHTFILDLPSKIASIDSRQMSISAGSTAFRANFVLFGWNYTSGIHPNKSRISYAKAEVSGSVLREYIACKNGSGVAGLWDDANGVFYGDAAGGKFIAGPAKDPMTPHDGHNTNIGNVAYEIEGGTARMNGVGYEIESGTTRASGVSREISFGPSVFTVKITVASNAGSSSGHYVTINGTKYYSTKTLEVDAGTVVSVYNTYSGEIYYNGTSKRGNTFSFTIENDATIAMTRPNVAGGYLYRTNITH